jgi:DMSO/TMAO reductase YedYZ molybdopterin-dependent catalytic subunit
MSANPYDDLSRRAFLARVIGGAAALGVAGITDIGTSRGQTGDVGSRHEKPLIVRVPRPLNAETLIEAFNSWLTPNRQFFVRSHFGPPPPELTQGSVWRLVVRGLVDRSLTLRLADLTQFEAVRVTAVLQCSGNGRAFYRPHAPGVQWERGAVGNAEWTGVRLRDVLQRAGIQRSARHVQMQGADRPVSERTPQFVRSIPLAKALHPDTLLATHMNGEPLPLLHGAPLRLITPGWMAEACMKWLTDLTVQEDEAQGYFMETAYRYPSQPVPPGTHPKPGDQIDMLPVEAMVVKSVIVQPNDEMVVPRGRVIIAGVAWTGEGRIVGVDVSTDEGRTWQQAELLGEAAPYAWRQWRFLWQANDTGPHTILSRAIDERGEVQPVASPWNPGGFLWNGMDRVRVRVDA